MSDKKSALDVYVEECLIVGADDERHRTAKRYTRNSVAQPTNREKSLKLEATYQPPYVRLK